MDFMYVMFVFVDVCVCVCVFVCVCVCAHTHAWLLMGSIEDIHLTPYTQILFKVHTMPWSDLWTRWEYQSNAISSRQHQFGVWKNDIASWEPEGC